MNKHKITSILYFIAGILFFMASIIGKNYVYIPIGCCFVILGIKYRKKDSIGK